MTEEKKTNTYKKPEVEVIKLDKDASFMTFSSITLSGEDGHGFQPGPAFPGGNNTIQTGSGSGQNVGGFEP